MKLLLLLFTIVVFTSITFANGVAVVNAESGEYLKLLSSKVEVSVEDQVAIVTAIQTYKNNLGKDKNVKFAFPMPEDGSATALEYYTNKQWHKASFAPTPQDTTLPGPGENVIPALKTYLGKTPFYFNVIDTIKTDSILVVRLTYVQLLKYANGKVQFNFPNDYSLIQTAILEKQELQFNLVSQRTIDSIYSVNHISTAINNEGKSALLTILRFESAADENYKIEFSLNSSELGLFSLSTTIADTLVPDKLGNGFFLFIAEPNPKQNTDVIKKVFTIIIDKSGSMWGDKMEQAKNAAGFIINNLNEGDDFNIVDFSSEVSSFRSAHVPFTFENRDAALSYISNLYADGMTNISGAFEKAIPQFSGAPEGTAKIIIFLTDGQPTVGLTATEEILNKVNSLASAIDTSVTIFNFGIGQDVNYQLLTLLATDNNGMAEFLENNELEERITQFYTRIRFPVLINTKMVFTPGIISETYPSPLPNLYKGQQLLVSGRYNSNTPVKVTLSGTAFGRSVSYSYDLNLIDTANSKYQFLTKVWAKVKIENLLVEYYKLNPNLMGAIKLKEEIRKLSLLYGVMSPFTSLSGNDPGGPSTGVEESGSDKEITSVKEFRLAGNYPNPFNPGTNITFTVSGIYSEFAVIRIYNVLGELIKTINVFIDRTGRYQVYWDGRLESGVIAPSGNYIYTITIGSAVLAGKMSLLK